MCICFLQFEVEYLFFFKIVLHCYRICYIFFFGRPRLKEHMQYCIEHPEEISKLSKLKAQITEVKGVMMDNIEKVKDNILSALALFDDMYAYIR